MSRRLIGLPRNAVQRKEDDTIELIKVLREKGYREEAFQKPNRIFKNGEDVVKINIRDGVIIHNTNRVFSGSRYGESVEYFKSLSPCTL